MAARLWTNGWDFFVPPEAVVYHLWTRSYRRTFQEVQPPEREERANKSRAQVRALLSGEAGPSPYGLGACRTLEAWVTYTGVDFKNSTINESAERGGTPFEMFADEMLNPEGDGKGGPKAALEDVVASLPASHATEAQAKLNALITKERDPSGLSIPDSVLDIMAMRGATLKKVPKMVPSPKVAIAKSPPSNRGLDLFSKLAEVDPSLSGKIMAMTGIQPADVQAERELDFVSPFFQDWDTRVEQSELNILTKSQLSSLKECGYVLLDSLFDEETAKTGKGKALEWSKTGELTPAGMSRQTGRWKDSTARGDLTKWLHDDGPGSLLEAHGGLCKNESPNDAFRPLLDLFHSLREDLGLALDLKRKMGEYQLALYPGEGKGYVRHRDAFPEEAKPGEEVRHVTAIIYTNEAWEESHGGKLRLYTKEGEIDVAPKAGQMVVFLSGLLDHEVLPAFTERVALTAWYR